MNMEICDIYDHEDPNLIYILENIPTQAIEKEFNQQFINGCKCTNSCNDENKCPCVNKSGAYYITSNYTQDYKIKINDENKPIYECNSTCKCYGILCGNRLVQFGPRKNLKIIVRDENSKILEAASNSKITETVTKGKRLITIEEIKERNFICEYAGELITHEEALKRHKLNQQQMLMNYIICINEHFGEVIRSTYIDPSKFGNIGRYLNHSCEPNCEIIPIRVNNAIPKLCIFAKQYIPQFEELTFDYGQGQTQCFDNTPDSTKIKCLCGSSNCKMYLPFLKYTNE